MGDHTIEDANLANDKLYEAVEEGELGMVVGMKIAKSELRRLRKTDCNMQRNQSTKVVRNNLRMVKDLVIEKSELK